MAKLHNIIAQKLVLQRYHNTYYIITIVIVTVTLLQQVAKRIILDILTFMHTQACTTCH